MRFIITQPVSIVHIHQILGNYHKNKQNAKQFFNKQIFMSNKVKH